MSNAVTITATIPAYLREVEYMADLADLLKAPADATKQRNFIGSRLVYSLHDMSGIWTRIGEAQITVTVVSRDEQVQAAIKSMQAQIDAKRAEFLQFQREMLERISKLQAIEYVAEA